MTNQAREALEKRAQKAIFEHAIFRWESAVVIALTILITFFMFLGQNPNLNLPLPELLKAIPWWTWLVGGTAAEALLVYSSLTDSETGRIAIAEMLKNEFRPERLREPRLQEQIKEAFDYRSRIAAYIQEQANGILKDNLIETASQFDEWLEEIYSLAQRLDRYQFERKLQQKNEEQASTRIRELQEQLRRETNPALRQEIEANLESRERQRQTIQELTATMERARLRLENTITAMGTIYTQTMLFNAKDIDSGRAKRLRQDIADEVSELNDILVAMDDVYQVGNQA